MVRQKSQKANKVKRQNTNQPKKSYHNQKVQLHSEQSQQQNEKGQYQWVQYQVYQEQEADENNSLQKKVYLNKGSISDTKEGYNSKQKIKPNQTYYRIKNPFFTQQTGRQQEQTNKFHPLSQLTLKNLIILLLFISVLMFSLYKILQQVYQIQHPQLNKLDIKLNQNRITVVSNSKKQKSIDQSNSDNQLNQINRLQLVQKRFQQTFQKQKNNQNQHQKHQKHQNQQNMFQNLQKKQFYRKQLNHPNNVKKQFKTAQDQIKQEHNKLQHFNDVIKQRRQVIEGVQNLNQQPQNKLQDNKKQPDIQNTQNPSAIQQKIHDKTQNTIYPQRSQPISRKGTRFSTQKPGPVSKAGISSQHAIKWKPFLDMISLPLGMPINQNSMLEQQYQYYQNKYKISQYKQLPICVVVPTYNNVAGHRYSVNLKSILQQNYSNYHVVIIDDKSQDRTGQAIERYLNNLNSSYREKVQLVINKQRKMAMPNLRYAALNLCKQQELFIIIDGDDSIVGRQVFKLVSAVMQKNDYWVLWTNFLTPRGTIGYSRDYIPAHKKMNSYRKAGFVMSHLRAYYTKLFRLIKQQDLKDEQGEYFHAANDVAICIPILQMAHMHTGYIPQLTYYYNLNTGLNNHQVRLKEQKKNDKIVRKKASYAALQNLGFRTSNYQKINQLQTQSAQNQRIDSAGQKQINNVQQKKMNNDGQQQQKQMQQIKDLKDEFHQEQLNAGASNQVQQSQNKQLLDPFDNIEQNVQNKQQIKKAMKQMQLDLHRQSN